MVYLLVAEDSSLDQGHHLLRFHRLLDSEEVELLRRGRILEDEDPMPRCWRVRQPISSSHVEQIEPCEHHEPSGASSCDPPEDLTEEQASDRSRRLDLLPHSAQLEMEVAEEEENSARTTVKEDATDEETAAAMTEATVSQSE